jgi:hypothetical protein
MPLGFLPFRSKDEDCLIELPEKSELAYGRETDDR